MSRMIEDVYKSMFIIIPETEIDLHKELKKFISSLFYKAPEFRTSTEVYIIYFNILLKYIPKYFNLNDNDPQWMLKCRDIFANISS
jgi:hypothetical protein